MFTARTFVLSTRYFLWTKIFSIFLHLLFLAPGKSSLKPEKIFDVLENFLPFLYLKRKRQMREKKSGKFLYCGNRGAQSRSDRSSKITEPYLDRIFSPIFCIPVRFTSSRSTDSQIRKVYLASETPQQGFARAWKQTKFSQMPAVFFNASPEKMIHVYLASIINVPLFPLFYSAIETLYFHFRMIYAQVLSAVFKFFEVNFARWAFIHWLNWMAIFYFFFHDNRFVLADFKKNMHGTEKRSLVISMAKMRNLVSPFLTLLTPRHTLFIL